MQSSLVGFQRSEFSNAHGLWRSTMWAPVKAPVGSIHEIRTIKITVLSYIGFEVKSQFIWSYSHRQIDHGLNKIDHIFINLLNLTVMVVFDYIEISITYKRNVGK